jgi:DNA-binding transcriptional regulator YdaS (Cro superfamily)
MVPAALQVPALRCTVMQQSTAVPVFCFRPILDWQHLDGTASCRLASIQLNHLLWDRIAESHCMAQI